MIVKQDLENVSPYGRLDVLVYRLSERYAKSLEQEHGLSGIWDNFKPHVNELVNKYVSGVELPAEAKILLGIVQANMGGSNVGIKGK